MPKMKLQLVGRRDFERSVRRYGEKVRVNMRQAVAESALKIDREAKELAPVDVGILRRSVTHEFLSGGLVGEIGVEADYAEWVEFGTQPHFPPVDPLEDWARRHGMPGAGFAIAKKIAERGTEPQPFLHPAFEAERGPFQRAAAQALRNASRRR